MKLILAVLVFAAPTVFACDVLFLDFNNSRQEMDSCRDGIYANNQATNQSDDDSDQLGVVGQGKAVDAANISKKLAEYRRHHMCIDSILISGHQIGGVFSGENGAIASSTLRDLIKAYPDVLGENLESDALAGCYSTVEERCQNDYLKSLSPHLKTAVGFTLQGPSNKQEVDWNAIKYYCQTRKQAAEAQDAARLQDYLNHMPDQENLAIGICIDTGICSRQYHIKGGSNSCYHSYDELQARCATMSKDGDKSGNLQRLWQDLYAADKPQCAEPPLDEGDDFGEDAAAPAPSTECVPGQKGNPKMNLRWYYSYYVNLWGHCSENYEHEFGSPLPSPSQVMRLVKFHELKANIQNLHGNQIASYNRALQQAGLGQYALGNLNTLTRKQIRDNLDAVISVVDGQGGARRARRAPPQAAADNSPGDFFSNLFSGASQVSPRQAPSNYDTSGMDPRIRKMANALADTLINLKDGCASANLIHENGTVHSRCIDRAGF